MRPLCGCPARRERVGRGRRLEMARTQAAPVKPRYLAPLKMTQDWDEASTLIAQYLPTVHHIVRRYHCSFNDREDLYQEGCLVILEAARDYRETPGETF